MVQASIDTISITLRFYGDLRNLLYRTPDGLTLNRNLPEPTSVKDLIEGCGVPHTEVDLILSDGHPIDFSTLVKGGEHLSVYPFFILSLSHLNIVCKSRLWKIPPLLLM